MKRKALIQHIERNECVFLREGRNHTIYVNKREKKVSTIPRHREIDNYLSRKICKDLGIPDP
ncbi:MAG: type II toxin-antitoxin system HicA family toxin [Deltaproteobacteria bacterium]|nr:type II toxin-antitoxin system HicA family toxin [Deltaproteobacteria bacterium]